MSSSYHSLKVASIGSNSETPRGSADETGERGRFFGSGRWLQRFAEQSCHSILAEMVACLLVIGALDFVTGFDIRLLPLYSGPVFVVAWFCGRRKAIFTALFAGAIWLFSDWFTGDPDLRTWVAIWETGRHFGFFLIVAVLGSALRAKDEMAAARIALLEHSQRLEHEIVNISQAEQRRIGQDLHDGLCQYLAALTCSATSLRDDLQKSHQNQEAQTAADLAKHLQEAVVQTRDLARGLVPAHLSHVGIAVALEALAQAVARLHGIKCVFQLHGEAAEYDDETAMHLYRITQEAINNATRHGQARKVDISLAADDNLMTLRIADDGVGMSGSESNGMGLGLMQYRARLAGGELSIEQPATGGTVVSCRVRRNEGSSGPGAA